MTAAPGGGSHPEPPARVSSGSALVLLVAVLAVGALVVVGVGGLLPDPDVGVRRVRTVQSDLAVPALPAPVPELEGVAPAARFDEPTASLPDLPSGAFREVARAWRVGEQGAEARPSGRSSTMAVVTAPVGTDTVAVTLGEVRPGAGVVTAWTGPDDHIALVVDASGRDVTLRVADGGEVDVPLRAALEDPGGPLVLGLRLVEGRVEAIANGVVLTSRSVRETGDGWVGGMVAGPGRAGESARFRDLTFG